MILQYRSPRGHRGNENNQMTNEFDPISEPYDDLDQASGSSLSFALLLRLLRGRWHWAVLFALVFGAGGLYVGYNVQQDLYMGESTIELKPNYNVPIDVQDAQLNQPYMNFVTAEIRTLESRELIKSAMQKSEWQEAIAQRSPRLPEIKRRKFSKRLEVKPPGRNETVVEIQYVDEDPDTARAGVNSVLQAYREIHKQAKADQIDDNLELLQDQLSSLENEKAATESQIKLFISGQEMVMINARMNSKLAEKAKLEFRLTEIDLTLKPYLDSLSSNEPGELPLVPDEEMELLLEERKNLEDNYVYLTEVLNRGEGMRDVVQVRRSLVMVERKILELQNLRAENTGEPGEPNNATPPQIAELMAVRAGILEKVEELSAETSDLATRLSAVDDYKIKLEDTRTAIRATRDKINQYKATQGLRQNNDVSRIVIGPDEQTPSSPENSEKRIQLAGVGTVGGMLFGVGLVMLIGLMDRRIRHASDTVDGSAEANVIGVLPTLPADLKNAEDADAAAHCVHHIRTILQIGNERVFSITSPAAGSGKSSLATALGLSFSTSGSSTLVIDADLVGAGLSRRMGTVVHDSLESVIRKQGMMEEADLARALTLATSQGKPLDDVLLDEGLLDTERLDAALRLQCDTSLGLLEACHPGKLRSCVATTDVPNLSILPVGNAKPADSSKLSPAMIRELIAQAREAFDIVLIDTGPVLGSLEAPIAAAEADATVMIVSRGDNKSLASKSLDQLRSVRANVVGLVFNHALDSDLNHASYTSLVSQERRTTQNTRKNYLDKARSTRLGPLGTAVVSMIDEPSPSSNGTYLNGSSNGDED